MGRWLKRIGITLLIFSAVVFLAATALNFFLAVKIRESAVRALQKYTRDERVSIKSVSARVSLFPLFRKKLAVSVQLTELALFLKGLPVNAEGRIKVEFTDPFRGLREFKGNIDIGKLELGLPGRTVSLRGPLKFDRSALSWQGLRIGYAGEEFFSSGSVRDFASPSIRLGIYSQSLDLEASADTADKILSVSRFRVRSRGSELFLQGRFDFSRLPCLPAEISATTESLELADLRLFFAGMNAWEKAEPEGKLIGRINISGDLRVPEQLKINGEFKSSRLCAYGLTAGSLWANYQQDAGRGTLFLNFSFYEGTFNSRTALETGGPGVPFSARASLQGTQLEQLKQDTPLKNRDISGAVSCVAGTVGRLSDPASAETKGSVSVSKGKLLQLDILRGLGQLLFPELLTVTFEKGSSEFQIKENFIRFENIRLVSTLVELAGKGTLYFDDRVDALIHVQVSDQILPKLANLRKLAAPILSQTGKIVAVQVTGTRQNPKYSLRQPLISDIWGGLRDIFR